MSGGRGGARGQSSVELALALPLFALLVLAVVQVALVSRQGVAVVHAAREAARAVAIEHDAAAASRAASAAADLDAARVTVAVDGTIESGHLVTVTVRYAAPTDVPLVGALVGDVALAATAVMRVE